MTCTTLLALAACLAPQTATTTSATSTDTATAPSPTSTSGAWSELPPSARIVGLPGQHLSADVAVLELDGGGVIVASGLEEAHTDLGLPATLVLDGDVPPGEHLVTDLWDGVSSYDAPTVHRHVHGAGDVDDDGHDDLWIGGELHLGPVLGTALRYRQTAVAWLDDELELAVLAAGFDANGDGHEDMVSGSVVGGVVYHGPHAGLLPALRDADPPAEGVVLGPLGGRLDVQYAEVLHDHLGAGLHALAVGRWQETGNHVFALDVVPGTRLTADDALFSAWEAQPENLRVYAWDDAGDLDGDGAPDVLYGDATHGGFALAGPLDAVPPGPVADEPRALEVQPGTLEAAVGDVNGDGVQDLLGQVEHDGPLGPQLWWVLSLSPHDPVVDWAEALPLQLVGDTSWRGTDARHADLDGDGLADLIDTAIRHSDAVPAPAVDEIEAGEIRIWTGADLTAAYDALGAR